MRSVDASPAAGSGTDEIAIAATINSIRAASARIERPSGRFGQYIFGLSIGVIRGAHERADRRMLESQRQRLALELRERVLMHVARDRQMRLRRLQVLADRQHVDVV